MPSTIPLEPPWFNVGWWAPNQADRLDITPTLKRGVAGDGSWRVLGNHQGWCKILDITRPIASTKLAFCVANVHERSWDENVFFARIRCGFGGDGGCSMSSCLAVSCACGHDIPHQVSTALIFMMPALVLEEHEPEPTVLGKVKIWAKIEFKVTFLPP